MILRSSFVRALLHLATAILLMATIVAVTKRWQEGHWPNSDFYVSFLPALIIFPLLACVVVVPKAHRAY